MPTEFDGAAAIALLPTLPGVYRFRNAGGEVIYVGFRVGTACSNLGRGENDTTPSIHGAGSVVTLVAKLSNRRRIYFGPMGY